MDRQQRGQANKRLPLTFIDWGPDFCPTKNGATTFDPSDRLPILWQACRGQDQGPVF
jgi:hypothetical protein